LQYSFRDLSFKHDKGCDILGSASPYISKKILQIDCEKNVVKTKYVGKIELTSTVTCVGLAKFEMLMV